MEFQAPDGSVYRVRDIGKGEFRITGSDGRSLRITAPNTKGAIEAFTQYFDKIIAAKPKSYAQSRQSQQLMGVLEGRLKNGGSLSTEEQKVYNQLIRQKARDETVTGEFEAGMRGIQKGASFNLADEIGGAVKSAFGDNTYEHERDLIRSKDAIAAERYPDAFTQGEIGAAVATTLPLAVMSGGSALAPTLSQSAARYSPAAARALMALAKKQPLTTTIAKGAAGGAASEGLRAFADGEGVGNRLKKGLPAAGIGGVFGGLAPAAGHGAGKLWSQLANRPKPLTGMSRTTTQAIIPAFRDSDRALKGGVQRFLNDTGPNGTPADVPGGLQQQAQGLATVGGPGGSHLSRTLHSRHEGAAERISREIDRNLAPAEDAFNRQQALAAERASKLGPEYDAAMRANAMIEADPLRDSIAWSYQNAGPNTAPKLAKLYNALGDGEVTPQKLHAIRSDLSDDIAEASRTGRNKQAAALKQHLDEIDEALFDAVPGYQNAQTGWANNKALEEQIELGRKDLSGGQVTAQSLPEFQQEFDALSPAQQEARRAGMRRGMEGVMGTARNDASAARGQLNKGWNRDKLQHALGPDKAGAILRAVDAEDVFARTHNQVTQGSQTAARMAAKDALTIADPKNPTGLTTWTGGVSDRVRENIIVPALVAPKKQAVNTELGKFYASQGSARDAWISEIIERLGQKPKAQKRSALAQLLTDQLVRGAGASINTSILQGQRN